MPSIPVQYKPEIRIDFGKHVLEIENIIPEDVVGELKAFMHDTQVSGMHRSGSKTPDFVQASFDTCLMHHINHRIYTILDEYWVNYIKDLDYTINFIEPYELKLYTEGDGFSFHTDNYASIEYQMDRKINLIVQLSDASEYEGGDLYVGDFQCTRKYRSGIFFPAHYVHRVTKITRGKRYSMIGHAWGPYIK